MDAIVPECPGCVAAGQKIVGLERELAQLRARLKQMEEQMEALNRGAKRQAAPFSRGLPKADPQRPGRKAGEDYGTKAFRAVPPVIDEVYAAPLPAQVPALRGRGFSPAGCGGAVPGRDSPPAHLPAVQCGRRPVYLLRPTGAGPPSAADLR